MDLGCHRVSLLEPVEKASVSGRPLRENLGVLEPVEEALDRRPAAPDHCSMSLAPAKAHVMESEMVASAGPTRRRQSRRGSTHRRLRQNHIRHRPMACSAVVQDYSVTGWCEKWMVCHVQIHHCSCCCGPMLPLVLRDSQVHPSQGGPADLGCCCNQESPGRWAQI